MGKDLHATIIIMTTVSLRYNESDAREARRDTTGLMSYKPESLARNVVPMLNVN